MKSSLISKTFNKTKKEYQKELDEGGDLMEIAKNDIALNKHLKKLQKKKGKKYP